MVRHQPVLAVRSISTYGRRRSVPIWLCSSGCHRVHRTMSIRPTGRSSCWRWRGTSRPLEESPVEAYLSTQCPEAVEATRLPQTDVLPRRSGCDSVPSAQGPTPVVGLIWRLRDRRTFGELHTVGHRATRGSVTALWLPGSPPPRVAFAVGRPVGNAVTRNRVKRRLRAAVTALDASETGLPGGAWLFRARPDAAQRPYDRLRGDLEAVVEAARRR